MDHNNNNNNNNNRTFHKVARPLHCFQVEFKSGMSVFVEGEKPEDLEKTLAARTGIEPRRALSPLHYSHSPLSLP